jgi:glutamyl-Q tRNA(Asp) synthetase
MTYIGRFAPSPTGHLHAGSLVAAVASFLDVRAHGGRWLLRIEDIDPPREVAGASNQIIAALAAFGFVWDGAIEFQSRRCEHYQSAFETLLARGHVYGCVCSRKEIGEQVYPGTCRNGIAANAQPRAYRVRVNNETIVWQDRLAGESVEPLARTSGDFVIKRADELWAYQLAVVVDDALQGVNQIVRGDDLKDSTARQIYLQQLLALPRPGYLHVPVVRAADGQKLSKQTGARALDGRHALNELRQAALHLQLGLISAASLTDFWPAATEAWSQRNLIR